MNNFEKIKNMSIEEMAEWLVGLQKHTSDKLLFDIGMIELPKTPNLPELTLKSSIKSYKQWLESESEEQCQK